MVKLEEPDKGRAWVVAIAICCVHMVMIGMQRLRSLLYVAVIATYGVSRQDAAAPFTLSEAIRCLGGPIIGIIGQRYGVKAVVFGGGVIGSLGIALSWVAPNIFWLTIFWGGLFGFGLGLACTLTSVPINQYFVKYKATASGIGFSGSTIGSLVLPFILATVLDTYGLSGGFLILGGITLHILPVSMLLKTPQWVEDPKQYARLKALKMKQRTSETLEKGLPEASPEGNGKVRVQECSIDKLSSSLGNILLEKLDKCSIDTSLEKEINRKNFSENGGIISSQKSHAIPMPVVDGESERKQSDINPSATCEKTCEVSSVKRTAFLESIRGIGTLYTSPVFVLMSACMAVYTLTLVCTQIVFVDYGKDKRIPDSYGIHMINSLTVGDLTGRLSLGWVTDKKLLSLSTYLAMIFILQAVIFFLLPLVMNLYFYMMLLALYGITTGTVVSHFPLLFLHYVDSSLQSVAMGCEGFLSGIVSFAIPRFIGHFRDDVGSYDGMFYVMGAMTVVTACLWSLIPLLAGFQQKKDEQNKIIQEKKKMEQRG